MKVYIEVPDNWIDAESPMLWASTTIRDEARRAIKSAVIEQLISKTPLPDFSFTDDELRAAVKEKVIELLAERALKTLGNV